MQLLFVSPAWLSCLCPWSCGCAWCSCCSMATSLQPPMPCPSPPMPSAAVRWRAGPCRPCKPQCWRYACRCDRVSDRTVSSCCIHLSPCGRWKYGDVASAAERNLAGLAFSLAAVACWDSNAAVERLAACPRQMMIKAGAGGNIKFPLSMHRKCTTLTSQNLKRDGQDHFVGADYSSLRFLQRGCLESLITDWPQPLFAGACCII